MICVDNMLRKLLKSMRRINPIWRVHSRRTLKRWPLYPKSTMTLWISWKSATMWQCRVKRMHSPKRLISSKKNITLKLCRKKTPSQTGIESTMRQFREWTSRKLPSSQQCSIKRWATNLNSVNSRWRITRRFCKKMMRLARWRTSSRTQPRNSKNPGTTDSSCSFLQIRAWRKASKKKRGWHTPFINSNTHLPRPKSHSQRSTMIF